jgi:hypothetical protein
MCAMSFRKWELIQEYFSKDQIKRQRQLATGKRAPPQKVSALVPVGTEFP